MQHERIQEDRLAQAVSKLIHQGNVENTFLQRGIKPYICSIIRFMMRNFPKIFLRTWRAFEFSHGLLAAVSPKFDCVFGLGGCDISGVPSLSAPAEQTERA